MASAAGARDCIPGGGRQNADMIESRLGQERVTDVGRELGYRNGGAVSAMLKRLEKRFDTDAQMRRKKINYEKQLKRR